MRMRLLTRAGVLACAAALTIGALPPAVAGKARPGRVSLQELIDRAPNGSALKGLGGLRRAGSGPSVAESAQTADVEGDATTIRVTDGESIQAAIRAASPGDTIVVEPGVYRENLQITKDDITLLGSGAGPRGTVLKPPATPRATRCSFGDPNISNGICIAGDFDAETGAVSRYVENIRLSGFLIHGFRGIGNVVVIGARRTVVENNRARRSAFGFVNFASRRTRYLNNVAAYNEEYGLTAFFSSGTKFLYNTAFGSDDAGIYVGDSPRSNAVVKGNEVSDNLFGILLRDASYGSVSYNSAHANCAGMFLLNTGAPYPAAGWRVVRNQVFHNVEFCPPGEAPPTSGAGIVMAGTRGVVVRANTVGANVPSGESPLAGGIVLFSSAPFGGSDPVNNTISENVAFRNRPFDVLWDGSGRGNSFPRNFCGRSSPAFICN